MKKLAPARRNFLASRPNNVKCGKYGIQSPANALRIASLLTVEFTISTIQRPVNASALHPITACPLKFGTHKLVNANAIMWAYAAIPWSGILRYANAPALTQTTVSLQGV